jgi:hypothetical protein
MVECLPSKASSSNSIPPKKKKKKKGFFRAKGGVSLLSKGELQPWPNRETETIIYTPNLHMDLSSGREPWIGYSI